MIVYNTLIAIAVGAGLIGFALFLKQIWNKKTIDSEGWAAFFAVVGTVLSVLGFATTIAWPYGVGGFEYANIAFGEPTVAFGVLSLFAAVYLWRNRQLFTEQPAKVQDQVISALKPVSIFVFFTGLMMAVLAITWLRFQNGTAPEVEPISGLFHHLPLVEALFLFVLWAVVAVGCLLFPFALKKSAKKMMQTVLITWMIGGLLFGAFGAMNFYTHIGMYTNINKGTNYRI